MRLLAPLVLLAFLASCGSSAPEKKPLIAAGTDSLTRDFRTWHTYTYREIHLGRDFHGFDEKGAPLPKKAFLEELATGSFIAIRSGKGAVPEYHLRPLNSTDRDIRLTSMGMATEELRYAASEGQPVPAFSFTDLRGRRYTSAGTKGKFLVLKCWFIGCKACVQEFPELNALVDRYRHRGDVLFVSLTLDRQPALEAFLKAFPFRYAVVPEAESYITGKLGVQSYPHHVLVDKEGRIVKSAGNIADLLPALERLLAAGS